MGQILGVGVTHYHPYPPGFVPMSTTAHAENWINQAEVDEF